VVRLPAIGVSVTRSPEALSRLGASVTVLDSDAVRRHRGAPTLDDALGFVPGVVTSNRWNYSVDQRLAIRGFGARANFGMRGVKVLLDGVPQTLPDGQSQLTNLDLALVSRVEVLRGAASALHGNAAGGVIAFETSVVPTDRWSTSVRSEIGSFASHREQVVIAGRAGSLGGTAAFGTFHTDGSRQHAAAAQRQLSLGSDWTISPATTLTLRFATADNPRAQNPGALTAAELAVNRDSAAASNILRGADKSVTQSQLAVGVRHDAGRLHLDATIYGLTRALENPLATPPPAPATANAGTWVGIDRRDGGARLSATLSLRALAITGGADLQALRDDRINRRATGGVATSTLLLDQREEVTEIGPFLQAVWPILPRVTIRGGLRHDASRFAVTDHLLADADASGTRTMAATSGNVGVAVSLDRRVTVWGDVATLFETPTTTELANRPAGDGGFNEVLNPQRSVSAELGVRARLGHLAVESALYRTTTRDAIVPYREVGGRTYYRNAGHTRTIGAEIGATLFMGHGLSLRGTWTLTDAAFTDYRVVDGATTDVLDGHRLAGVPKQVARLGLRGEIGHGFSIDVDQAFSSSLFADDDNLIRVDGWGSGVTGVRAAWHGHAGALQLAPFAAAMNLFDRNYVGSVSINGAGGRVFEPSPRRTFYVGTEIKLRGTTTHPGA
jgi:iron complex outermembrane recepter protein